MAGSGIYNVYNNRNANVGVVDADGNVHNMIAGSNLQVALSAAGYASAVALFGQANVDPIVVNPTYRYVGLAVAPVATPTDFLVIQGSATKTVNVVKVRLSGAATAQGAMPFSLVRRSSAGTPGSAALTAVVPALTDTLNDPAATAVVSTVGTANYTTLGTANGVIESGRLGMPALATGTAGDAQAVTLKYGIDGDQPLKIRGVSDFICVNFGGAAVPSGGVVDFVVETYEDNS